MGLTLEELHAMDEAMNAKKMAQLDLMGPEELLDMYQAEIAAEEMATSQEALKRAQDNLAAIKDAILARMA